MISNSKICVKMENVEKGKRKSRKKNRIYRREGPEGKATNFFRGRCVETGTLQSFILILILSFTLPFFALYSMYPVYFGTSVLLENVVIGHTCLSDMGWWLLQTQFLKARFSLNPLLEWLYNFLNTNPSPAYKGCCKGGN